MSKVVTVNIFLDLNKDWAVKMQIFEQGNLLVGDKAYLTQNFELIMQTYQNWQQMYNEVCSHYATLAIEVCDFQVEDEQEAIDNCLEAATEFEQQFNDWLNSLELTRIREFCQQKLAKNEEVRILLETDSIEFRKLPWNKWQWLNKTFPNAEIVMSSAAFKRIDRPPIQPTLKGKVRILAVLGKDTQSISQELTNLIGEDREIIFLLQPTAKELKDKLTQAKGWDIFFFSGHSQLDSDGSGIFELRDREKLKIAQLKEAMQTAITKGLRIAIFNSCDGLGLAQELAEGQNLYLPEIIVMREPIPIEVAQYWLRYFLSAYQSGQSLYQSMSSARLQLEALEQQRGFLCASWLPVIVQNPAEIPPLWQELGRRPTEKSPYRGLFAFTETESEFFFGREKLIQQLLEAVLKHSLVTIIGPSGSGKSSVVFAGLIPKLKTSKNWQIISLRPENRPFYNLASALVSINSNLIKTSLEKQTRELTTALLQEVDNLANQVKKNLAQENTKGLLIVIDQFEELYTICPKDLAQQFLKQMLEAVKLSQANFAIVLTLRADFLGQALAERSFADVMADADQMIGPMNRQELISAISEPAKFLNINIEKSLIQRIINEVEGEGQLPLLQFALEQLWTKATEKSKQGEDFQLTNLIYDQIGGVRGALTQYAETVFNYQLNQEEKKLARLIFSQLVDPISHTRRIVNSDEIGEENWLLVKKLADTRLVITKHRFSLKTSGDLVENRTVELVHEALILHWQRLKEWVDTDLDFLNWKKELNPLLNKWKPTEDQKALLQGRLLVEAEDKLKQNSLKLNEQEINFIRLSIEARDKEVKIKKRNLLVFISLLSMGLVIMSVVAILAIWFRERALKSLEEQVIALDNSSKFLRESGQNFDALMAAMRAATPIVKKDISPESRIIDQVINTLQKAIFEVREFNRLEGHQDEVWDLSFSPDGELLASASFDRTIKIWDKQGRLLQTLEGHQGGVTSVSFSPDNQRLISTSFDKSVKIWDLITGQEIKSLAKHDDWTYHAIFSPSGDLIATASKDGTVKLWTKDGEYLKDLDVTPPRKGDGGFNKLSFSPNGDILAASSWDGTIRLWYQNQAWQEVIIEVDDLPVNTVSFSPDGQIIATGSGDSTIKLWRLDGTEITSFNSVVEPFSSHRQQVSRVIFSPNGGTLVSSSFDGKIKLWTIEGQEIKPELTGHLNAVHSVVFHPQGNFIASGGFDGTIRFWSYREQKFQIMKKSGENLDNNVRSVAFSKNGQLLGVANQDGTVNIYNFQRQELFSLKDQNNKAHNGIVTSIIFSPNEQIIATTSDDKTIKIWNLNGELLKTLQGEQHLGLQHQDLVDNLSFSPTAHNLMFSGDWSGVIIIWQDGKAIEKIQAHSDRIYDVSFDPDGEIVATASKDGTVKFWSKEGKNLGELKNAHSSQVYTVDFSSDGQFIVTASRDGTAKVWINDYQSEQPPLAILRGHTNQVYSARFSPNGQMIITGGHDGTVRLWNLQGQNLQVFSVHTQSVDTVVFSPNGKTAVSGSRDDQVILWSLESEEIEQSSALWKLDLNQLFKHGCFLIDNYLQSNSNISQAEQNMCDF